MSATLCMNALLERFPSLSDRCPLFFEDFGATEVLRWLCSTGLSHGERCAVRFLLAVWNPSTNWVELAAEMELENPPAAARFDVMEALGVWDDAHRSAFLEWARRPWFP